MPRGALLSAFETDAMKPLDELISLTQDEHAASARLGCAAEYVVAWRPREHWVTKRIEPGLEPSAGFIAAALAILRNV